MAMPGAPAPVDADDGAGGLRMGDHARQLGGAGDEEGLLVFVEAALFDLLDHQHAEHAALVDDRYTEEGAVEFFADAGQEQEAGVGLGVVEIERFFAGGDLADQALVRRQADLADEAGVQAFVGHEHITAAVRISQVHGADFGAHDVAHPPHDDIERDLQVIGGVDFLHDTAQGVEHGGFAVHVLS
jgi:hypothetical protein